MWLRRPRKARLFAIAFVELSEQSRQIGDFFILSDKLVPGVPRPVEMSGSADWLQVNSPHSKLATYQSHRPKVTGK